MHLLALLLPTCSRVLVKLWFIEKCRELDGEKAEVSAELREVLGENGRLESNVKDLRSLTLDLCAKVRACVCVRVRVCVCVQTCNGTALHTTVMCLHVGCMLCCASTLHVVCASM